MRTDYKSPAQEQILALKVAVHCLLEATDPYEENAAPHETGSLTDFRNWEALAKARYEADALLREI